MGVSKFVNLQHHRIAQCRSLKITILGDEAVPVQVDGEAWLQNPGFIRIKHKNRAQMLSHDKIFAEALRSWMKNERRSSEQTDSTLTDQEMSVLNDFISVTERFTEW